MTFDPTAFAPDADVKKTNDDTLPAKGGQYILDSGVYDMDVDMAWVTKTVNGATMMHVHLKDRTTGFIHRERNICIASGDAKGNKTTYKDSEGEKQYIPGYNLIWSLCVCATGKPFNQQTFEKKTIKLWDFDAGAEMPVEVDCCTSLLGQHVKVGLVKVRENKRANQNGTWVDTNDEKLSNEVEHFFDANGRTRTEINAGEKAEHIHKWTDRFEGELLDRYKPVAGAPAATPSPSAGSAGSTGNDAPLFS